MRPVWRNSVLFAIIPGWRTTRMAVSGSGIEDGLPDRDRRTTASFEPPLILTSVHPPSVFLSIFACLLCLTGAERWRRPRIPLIWPMRLITTTAS